LALWFALNLLFTQTFDLNWGIISLQLPLLASVHWAALALSALACIMLFGLKLRMLTMLGLCALLGMAWRIILAY
jgi:chromate transporter